MAEREPTFFEAVLDRIGLSKEDAADTLDVRADTVRKWAKGEDPVPPGVWKELWELAQARIGEADATAWEFARSGFETLLVHGTNHFAARMWEKLPKGTPIELADGTVVG
jgi:hypothetical protein